MRSRRAWIALLTLSPLEGGLAAFRGRQRQRQRRLDEEFTPEAFESASNHTSASSGVNVVEPYFLETSAPSTEAPRGGEDSEAGREGATFAPDDEDTAAPAPDDPLAAASAAGSSSQLHQPRVTVVEGLPSQCGLASISNPAGTAWCQGAPTYWVTGHQKDERPRCLKDGVWVNSRTAMMNLTKDRHACVTMDVDRDGYDDIICNVGAGRGMGEGYNELFLTDPATGSINQVLSNPRGPNPYASPSGLQKYPTMRNRLAVILRKKAGEKAYVFMGTKGIPRDDGRPNQHRMFKNVYSRHDKFPYFVEVAGPWTRRMFDAVCAIAGDFTGDGRDDLVVCDVDGPAMLVRQHAAEPDAFVEVPIPNGSPYVRQWQNARLADVTGDGRNDLVVVTGARWSSEEPSYLIVFRGIPTSPFFDFLNPCFRRRMPYFSPDVEVLDVNNDGRADIYVVQVDDREGMYCGPDGRVIILPPNVVPPLDRAPDVLFLGVAGGRRFRPVPMQHAQPGCGDIAQRWDDRTMLLSQGSMDHSGYQLLLEW